MSNVDMFISEFVFGGHFSTSDDSNLRFVLASK